MWCSSIFICLLHVGKIWQQYENNKLKIIASALTDEFELPDGSYSVSDIQDCIVYIIKNMTH